MTVTDSDIGKNIAAALAAFQADMPTIAKNRTADTGKYRYDYADLADITHAAMPLLARQGLSFSCLPAMSYDGAGMALEGALIHTSGEKIVGRLPIRGGTAQEIGSALTYMRRYLFGCLTGIVTEADDDGRAASKPAKRAAPRRSSMGDNDPPDETGEQVTPAQIRKMGAAMSARGLTIREDALGYVESIIGRPVESRNELTKAEASKVIDALEQAPTGAES
jgi:hypothetical protein